MTHNTAENGAPCPDCTVTYRCDAHWCCAACDAAEQGIPVPCDPDGEPIHGRVYPPGVGEHHGRWIDKHGDVWTLGDDGLLHTPETRPFPRDHVEKKWGPLRPAKEFI